MDLDNLKLVNDALGHAAGDALIRELVDRCKRQLGTDDVFGSFGGDEFIFGSCRFTNKKEALRWGDEVLSCLATPFVYQSQPLRISAAAGLAQAPEDGRSLDELLLLADLAMYESKAAPRRELRVATSDMRAGARQQALVREDVRRGLAAGEFELFFQPKITLTDRAIGGFEALVRWRHPDRGLLSPDDFLPAIGQQMLGLDLAKYVIDGARRQACVWRAEGLGSGQCQLGDPAICDPALSIGDDQCGLEPFSNVVEFFAVSRNDQNGPSRVSAHRSAG